MRAAGARLPKWPAADARQATGWSGLTEAERRVAVLIGSGHTNKSAASELGVSINTVGTHLRSIFAKLDIQSRTAAGERSIPPAGRRSPAGAPQGAGPRG
jgi:DNA-binding CsgD family transcriptional regulator